MTPTRLRTLLAIALVVGVPAYALFRWRYSSLPPLPNTASVTTLALALADVFLASGTRARLDGRPGTKPIMPMTVARIAALAKASSALGAIGVGAWTGIGAYVVTKVDLATPRADAIRAGIGLVTSVLLVLSALRLENVCRVPPPPPEAEPGP